MLRKKRTVEPCFFIVVVAVVVVVALVVVVIGRSGEGHRILNSFEKMKHNYCCIMKVKDASKLNLGMKTYTRVKYNSAGVLCIYAEDFSLYQPKGREREIFERT